MQTFIYLIIAMLVTLQCFVQVTGTDNTMSTTQNTVDTTTTVTNQIDSTKHTHYLDSSNVVDRDSKQLDNSLDSKSLDEPLKIDHDTKIKVEKNLLSIFGMSKRPKPIDRTKVVIPDAMKALYAEIMGEELRESVNIPRPGLHTKSANTVRSFTHEGKHRLKNHIYYFYGKIRSFFINNISSLRMCKDLHI